MHLVERRTYVRKRHVEKINNVKIKRTRADNRIRQVVKRNGMRRCSSGSSVRKPDIMKILYFSVHAIEIWQTN
ncbi:hypothetical protein D3C86_2222060 [compost metagenome]